MSFLHISNILFDNDKFNYYFFFFSSRRRHTRSYGDWSSDVCSSDLEEGCCHDSKRLADNEPCQHSKGDLCMLSRETYFDTRSEERRVGKSVDLGGRRIIKKKKRKE